MSRIWRIVASKSAVSVLVIDCTATGAPPPIGTPPTVIWRLEATSPKGSEGWPIHGPATRLARVARSTLGRTDRREGRAEEMRDRTRAPETQRALARGV